jgi:hypothetical protein
LAADFAGAFAGAALATGFVAALAGAALAADFAGAFAGAAFTALATGLVATDAVTRLVALAAARVVLVELELPLALFWLETTGDLSPLARTDDRRARGLNTAKRG